MSISEECKSMETCGSGFLDQTTSMPMLAKAENMLAFFASHSQRCPRASDGEQRSLLIARRATSYWAGVLPGMSRKPRLTQCAR
ncbi:hypothetical protein RFM26_06900 [Mesorhizobium sp. VK23B]|nr:hypothetical protein [Mesorhizobium sp. VK23B]